MHENDPKVDISETESPVDLAAVQRICGEMDELLALPEKRMGEYYRHCFVKLDPLVRGVLVGWFRPYGLDEESLPINFHDASKTFYELGRSIGCYTMGDPNERQRALMGRYRRKIKGLYEVYRSEENKLKALKKAVVAEQDDRWKKIDMQIDSCDDKTQSVIEYERCKRICTRGRSGFHFSARRSPLPFTFCGYADTDRPWCGVAFSVNRDCFFDRVPELYYLDGDYAYASWSSPFPAGLQEGRVAYEREDDTRLGMLTWLCNRIEKYSSGLADVHIRCQRETDASGNSARRMLMICFRLDSGAIKDTVLMSRKGEVPTSELGGYVFVLPRVGEFNIELGEMVDGRRVPLHFDDFCMK